jgi:glycosyltransferase involved in cell wall biosynthesis
LNLQKVYLADQLVALADGLVAMPSASGTDPLKAYFPQLVLDEAARTKPLRMIAEGIQLLQEMPADETQDALLTGLCDVESAQQDARLDLAFQNRPIMLNVGRLHPVKQQHVLVQAWAESGLWRTYNLVLIGGNFEQPTETEREIQARIDATFAQYPAARGRFCFLPAMPNAQVRALESAIIKTLPAPRPHVYACSSEKEEFGIAVLEAMDAGFLAFGPEIGGLSSYITTGENGFLVDTGSADSMAAALVEVLLGDRFTPRMLHDVAERGQQTVRERFDIRTTAKAFVDFYESTDSSDR